MGALVTLELGADAPQHDLPWIITFGPLDDDQEWEPVVCGPYERPHALAIAQHIVADEELMAVVEPLLPATSPQVIRAEISAAQRQAIEEADDLTEDLTEALEEALDDADLDGPMHAPDVPTESELRAGFARIAERLADA